MAERYCVPTVDLRGVVELEEPLQQLSVGDPLSVERHPDTLGVAGIAGKNLSITRVGQFPALIPGDRVDHTRNLLETILDSPETPAGEVGGFRLRWSRLGR